MRCPAGHDSDEPDYCSVCGAPMAAMGGGASGPAPSAGSANVCPSCGEPRAVPDARFCEVCRYDFTQQRPATPRVVKAAASPAPPAVSAAARAWELVISIDPTLDTEPDPATPCPSGEPPMVLTIDAAELLVGRRDDRRDIRPDVPLADPGASRRHAKFVRNADGSIALQDLASTNGTKLNGKDVEAGSRHRLNDGDEVTLGRWTRIRLRSVP